MYAGLSPTCGSEGMKKASSFVQHHVYIYIQGTRCNLKKKSEHFRSPQTKFPCCLTIPWVLSPYQRVHCIKVKSNLALHDEMYFSCSAVHKE